MPPLGRAFIIIGIVLIALGIMLSYGGHVPFLGRLPGDILVKRGDHTFYFPLTTCILLSALLTIAVYFFRK
jgi:hypothetical protein